MTDTFIEQYAADSRAMARQVLDWKLDSLRITAGLVEVIEHDTSKALDRPLTRRTRHLLNPGARLMLCDRPCAAYAHFHFVRDTERNTMPETKTHPVCPRCGGAIPSEENPGAYPGATSRLDNETEICSKCGTAEAMFNFTRPGEPLPPLDQPVS